jgi:heme-degrading monooxygenase HmoA
MFARVTPFEIDTVRMPLADAERLFDERVVPRLEQQPGLRGYYVMRTDEGKGIVLTLWDTEAAATAGVESGYYDEQIATFLTIMRQPPGREHYKVVREKTPAPSAARTGG